MKKLLYLLFLWPACLAAQVSNPSIISVVTAPSGACSSGLPNQQVISTGIQYSCQSGTWAAISGSGTSPVTSVFTRTGAVVAASGDYTVAQVTGAAPLASPTFTGTVAITGATTTIQDATAATQTAVTLGNGTNTGGTKVLVNGVSAQAGNIFEVDTAGSPVLVVSPSSGAEVFGPLSVQSYLTTGNGINNGASQTTVSCSTSGNAVFSEPEVGPSYKTVIVHTAACVGTASYTYPIAFSFAPMVISQSLTAIAGTPSATAVTITGTTSTGFLELVGY